MDSAPSASPAQPDQALLAAMAAGDPLAFEQLVRCHQGLVLAACRRQLPAADADDAMQAVFLVLARKPGQAARAPSLESWLLRTSRHVSATAIRARRRRQRAEQEAAMQAPPPMPPPSDDPEVLPLLDACLDELPERERIAISMHYLAGRSHDEVATALACPKGTVYSLLSRGLERLRGKLARRGAAIAAPALLALLASQAHAASVPLAVTAASATPAAHALATSTLTHLTMTTIIVPTVALLAIGGVATALVLPRIASAPTVPATPAPLIPGPAAIAPAVEPQGDTAPTAVPVAGTRLRLRLIDPARTATRWKETPYPKLLTTSWGTWSMLQSAPQLERSGLLALVTTASSATVDVVIAGGEATGQVLATSTQPATLATALQANLTQVTSADGKVHASAPLSALLTPQGVKAAGEQLLPLAGSPGDAPADPLADSEATWAVRSPWAAAPAGATGSPVPAELVLTADWTLTTYGLSERVRMAGLPPLGQAVAPLTAADRAVFATLPGDALWAVATAPLPVLAERIPTMGTAAIDTWLAGSALASWKELGPRLGGALLWLQPGTPQPPLPTFPSLTCELAMPKDLGDQLLARATAQHQLEADADGTLHGQLGMLTLHAGWRDGWLVLTTNPKGLPGVARNGGFTAKPGIAEALKTLPSGDLLVAGVSRGGESWSAIGELPGAWLAQVRPEFGSFTGDLRAAGSFGFLALRRQDDALLLDAGGLFGGPLSATGIVGGLMRQVIDSRVPPKAAPAAQPAAEPPPEKTAPPF